MRLATIDKVNAVHPMLKGFNRTVNLGHHTTGNDSALLEPIDFIRLQG